MGAILPSYESFKRLGLVRNGADAANLVALRSKNEYLEQIVPKTAITHRYPRSIVRALRQ